VLSGTLAALAAISLTLPACGPAGSPPDEGQAGSPPPAGIAYAAEHVAAASDAVRAEELSQWTRDLADDRMQGRFPGSPGEEETVAYLVAAYKEMGLKPVQGDSYTQAVPLVGITPDEGMKLTIKGKGEPKLLRYRDDFMAGTTREQERINAEGELVFVGYGVVAPEFGWDDYKGMDVRGKILVMLVNDPPLADTSRFGGAAMTYYGRWTYKYEIGAQKGASGVLLVHETERAGYPWSVVTGSWSGEQFVPQRADHGASRLPFESWVTREAASSILALAGQDFEALKAKAAQDDFRPVPLGLTASLGFSNTFRRVDSKNVAGLLPGTDLADEWVIFTAHWDHLGLGDPDAEGDRIYNGAFDNATGVAALLGIGRAFAALPSPPRRSILFLAVTAEEQGLIGSYHYADHPLHPLARTAAVINMDGMNVHGRTSDLIVIGLGNTTLDDLVLTVASEQGRRVVPDQEPEKGFYYRSDQFPFAKKGVPALYLDHGIEYVGRPAGWGKEQNSRYTSDHYHKPSDEFDPSWDFSGMVDDTRLLFRVGLMTAQDDRMPRWKEGTEFKAVREQSLAGAGAAP
jgi:Zn-dependent M28 family amino/carboxypeptidase